MFSDRALAELEARRQLLLTTAEARRVLLQGQVRELVEGMGWVDRVAGWCRRARPWLWAAAPVVGYAAARRGRRLLRLVPLVVPWWRVFRSVVGRFGSNRL